MLGLAGVAATTAEELAGVAANTAEGVEATLALAGSEITADEEGGFCRVWAWV